MYLSEVVAVTAEHSRFPPGRVRWLARRLQEIDALPKGPGGRTAPHLTHEHVALLILALLVDGTTYDAARTAVRLAGYSNDGMRADRFIGRLLASARADITPTSVLAFDTSVTVHGGSQEAVIARTTCTDDPLETAFTEDGSAYKPHEAATVVPAFTMPGRLLHRIGRALNGEAV